MPRMVSRMEPTTCAVIAKVLHKYSCRESKVTTSPEKVENVDKPPRNPVMIKRRTSGGISLWRANNSIEIPIRKPATKFDTNVPSGRVGNNGVSVMLNHQRSQQPVIPPTPTASQL